jgi:predicted kinase
MDFDAAGRRDLRTHFLNSYLEQSGDWEGTRVLPYYLCRQALVRGKVQSLLANQPPAGSPEAQQARTSARHYFQLSCQYTQPRSGCMVVFCGLSGSGKSTLARALASEVGGVHIRSDAVRKHLAGIPIDQPGGEDTYDAEMTRKTYSRLSELGLTLASQGNIVILDATYPRSELRAALIHQARALSIPLHFVHCTAPLDVLRQRLMERRGDISDATAAILTSQVERFEPFRTEELSHATTIDTRQSAGLSAVTQWVKSHNGV